MGPGPDVHHVDDHRPPVAWAAVGALTALALALRLVRLDTGLWIDEVYSLLDAFRQPFGHLLTVYVSDNQHPLYSLAARASLGLFGESPWAIRLPAVLFGVATVPALYALGRETVGEREGFLAAALLAVSYHHVWFSQNARGYTALAFFAVVATWALLRGLRTGRRGPFVLYAILSGLGAYTHLTMVFLAVAQAVVAVAVVLRPPRGWRPTWTGVAIAFPGGAAATLLLYAPVLSQVMDYFLNTPSRFVGVSTRRWAILETLRQLQVGFGAWAGAALALGFLAGGVIRLVRRAPIAFALFTAPAVAVVLGATLARGTMYPRFFFFMAGFAVLILVEGAMQAAALVGRLGGRRPTWASGLGAVFAGVLIAGSAASLSFNYRFPKQDFEAGRRYVQERRSPGDPVYVLGATERPYRDLWGLDWAVLESPGDLAPAASGADTWVVYAMPRLTSATYPEIWERLSAACPEPARFRGTVGDGDVYVCRIPSTTPGSGSDA